MKRDILRIIEENMDGFSKGQRQIARYLLAHYDKAAYMTAAKLGAEVSVSESTVVRFVMELGYAGYPEFQKALQELIRTKLTSFQRMEVTNHLIGDGDVLEKVLNTNVDNIRHTLESISRTAFHDAVDALVKAKNIYIIGVRSSAMLANFLSYSLQMVFDNVRLIDTTAGSELFQQMMAIGEGVSQSGNLPAVCSMSTATKRSMEPKGARWIMTGRCFLLSSPTYSSWNL